MRKKTKKLVFIFTAIVAFYFIGFYGVILYVDPLESFHKSFICTKESYGDMRYNAKRIIDNNDFDSLILGSSNMAHTSSLQASKLFGGKFINISLLGSNFKERKILLDYVLTKTAPKIIISTLDKYTIANLDALNAKQPNWDELYKQNSFKVYLNLEFISKIYKDFFSAIFNQNECHLNKNFDNAALNTPTFNSGIKFFATQEQLIKTIASSFDIKPIKINNQTLQAIKENIDQNLLNPAKKLSDTRFILLIPSYFIAFNAIDAQNKQIYPFQKEMIKYILSSKPKNLEVYGFDDMDFTNNPDNYADLGHYTQKIDAKILKLISEKKGLLDTKNFDKYWQIGEQKAKEFDLIKFYQEIKAAQQSKSLQ